MIGVNWFGTPSSFVRKLEKLGITVIYKQGSFDELYEHLLQDRPCIAFLKLWNCLIGASKQIMQ